MRSGRRASPHFVRCRGPAGSAAASIAGEALPDRSAPRPSVSGASWRGPRRAQMGYQHSGGEILVNTSTADGQFHPVTARLACGGYVILWLDLGGGGHGQVFDADGNKVGAEF